MRITLISLSLYLVFCFFCVVENVNAQTFQLVKSTDDLVVGYHYLFVYSKGSRAMSKVQNEKDRSSESVTIENEQITLGPDSDVAVFVLGGKEGAWTFFDENLQGYLYSPNLSTPQLRTTNTTSKSRNVIITVNDDGTCVLKTNNTRVYTYIRYSTTTRTFNNYGSAGDTNVSLYYFQPTLGEISPELSFDNTDYSAIYGERLDSPELINPHNLPITYTSSDEQVATVGVDGSLSLRNVEGSSVITATFLGNDVYASQSVSYNLNVTPKSISTDLFYKKITSLNEIKSDRTYIIVCEAKGAAMGDSFSSKKRGSSESVVISDELISIGETISSPQEFSVVKTSKGYYINLLGTNKYLEGNKNNTELTTNTSKHDWSIAFDEGNVKIQSVSKKSNYISYSNSNNYFRNFSSYGTEAYQPIQLYQKVGKITLSEKVNAHSTYYTGFAYELPEGLEGYAILAENIEDAQLNPYLAYSEGEQVPSGTALLIKGTQAGIYYPPVVNGSNAQSVGGLENNLLEGLRVDGYTASQRGDNVFYYKLTTLNGENPGFYWGSEDGGAFRLSKETTAYLAVPANMATRGFKFDVPTDITECITESRHSISEIYTINGLKVNVPLQQLPKGMYIIDGKKLYVR